MKVPIVDLHCDLLGCVEHDEDTLHFHSPEINCSLPQLLLGGVQMQTMAVATVTGKGSTKKAERQVDLYKLLLKNNASCIASFRQFEKETKRVHTLFGIENASCLAEEDEPLDKAFERFDAFADVERILYVSLTWNHENRFGGGNSSTIGLKADGEQLLQYLDNKRVTIDLSHTSDQLAADILSYIDKKSLQIIPIASHSNFRAITNVARNLPDHIAREIIRRGGLIGINFVRRFIGDNPCDFLSHIAHGLKLCGEDSLCFGADFYGGLNGMQDLIPDITFPTFQESFGNSACYPHFLSYLGRSLSSACIEKIACQNALRFLTRIFHK